MRTRNSNFPNNSNVTIPRRRNRGRAPNVVEPELRTIVEVAPMAERTMEELLRAPTEGYGEAIVLPEINADHFEIKTNLLQLVQASPFHGYERENPHAHINSFKRITSTLRFRDVPNDVIKLMMFPYSLEGAAKVCEAWKRFKEILRACPHHGFTELTQVDTFYNGLNENDQDSLNAAAGGNLLSKTTREALNIIENKSKVRYSRNKSNVSRMNTTSRESVSKTDERIDKLADQISTLVEIVSKKVVTPAPVKAVEESCITCGGAHAYYNCPNTYNNQSSVCAATEPTAKRQTRITPCLKNFKVIQKESIFHSNKTPQISLVFAITSALPTIKPKDSLIMGDEHLSTFRVEEIVPIPRESEDTFDNNKGCDLTFCDNNMIFSNPLFGSKDNLTSRDDESFLKEDVQEENFQVYSNPLFEFDDNHNSSNINPLFNEMVEDVESKDSNVSNFDEPVLLHTFFDEDECFDPGGDIDEIDAFLAIEVSTNIEEGYYDSEGDVFYLESFLSDDTTHNLSPEVFFDHEPQHFKNESDHDTLITFSPKNDPLHHEFAGELITLPPRIVREHKEYISRMWLLCGNSSSREEIDIFPGPDDSIPPGIKSEFASEEEIIYLDNLLNDDIYVPEYERFTVDIEPDVPVINNFDKLNEDECFDPGGGEINVEVVDSFTFFIRTFLLFLTYPEVSPLLPSTRSEDTIFDPGIFAFQFSSQESVAVKCLMEFCSSTCFIPKDE
ncbi:reverse transcriptase domain-containing protein [Tanacetum coccineum]